MKNKANCKLSIITINFNGWTDTHDLLRSIEEASIPLDFEVIVVDNGSTEDRSQSLTSEFSFVRVIRSLNNLGFASGNNLGIKEAEGEYLFFLNNDTLLPRHSGSAIENAISFLAQNRKVGAVSAKIKYTDKENTIQFAGSTPLSTITLRNDQVGSGEEDMGQYDAIRQIPYLHGAAMLLHRDIVSEVGGLPECYFLYYEELDWSCMIDKKYQIFYFPELVVYHKESSTTGQDSPLKIFYISRNRLLFAYRNRTGLNRILSLTYLSTVALAMNTFRYCIGGHFKQANSVIKGTFAFYQLRK